eukprot:5146537-Amphidinium_carterae.1
MYGFVQCATVWGGFRTSTVNAPEHQKHIAAGKRETKHVGSDERQHITMTFKTDLALEAASFGSHAQFFAVCPPGSHEVAVILCRLSRPLQAFGFCYLVSALRISEHPVAARVVVRSSQQRGLHIKPLHCSSLFLMLILARTTHAKPLLCLDPFFNQAALRTKGYLKRAQRRSK